MLITVNIQIFKILILFITMTSCIAQVPPSSDQMKCECTCTYVGNPQNKFKAVGNFAGSVNPITNPTSTAPPVPENTTAESVTKDNSVGSTVLQQATTELKKPNVEFIGGFDMLKGLMNSKKNEPVDSSNNLVNDSTTVLTTLSPTKPTTIRSTETFVTATASTGPLIQQPAPEPVQFKVGDANNGMKSVFSFNGKNIKPPPSPVAPVNFTSTTRVRESNKTGSIISGGIKESTYSVIAKAPEASHAQVKLSMKPVSDFQSASLGGGGGVVSSGVLSGVVRSEFKDGFRHKGGVIIESLDSKGKAAKANDVHYTSNTGQGSGQLSSGLAQASMQHITQPNVAINQMQYQNLPEQNAMQQMNMMMQLQQEPMEPAEMPANWQIMSRQGQQIMANPNSQMIRPQIPEAPTQAVPTASNIPVATAGRQTAGQPNNGRRNNWKPNQNQQRPTTQSSWQPTTQEPRGGWNVGTQPSTTRGQAWDQGTGQSTVSPPPNQWNGPPPKPNKGRNWNANKQNPRQNRRRNNMQSVTGAMPPSMTIGMMEQFGGGMEMANPYNMGMFPMGEMGGVNPFFFGSP